MRARALHRTLLLCRDFVDCPDEEIIQALTATTACLIAGAADVATVPGQSLITTLATLVLQLGCSLELVMPDAEILGHQPPFRGRGVVAALVGIAPEIMPGGVVTVATEPQRDSVVFLVGDATAPGLDAGARCWRLGWSGWSGNIGPIGEIARTSRAGVPLGALASAPLAAAEVFKAAIRHLPGADRHVEELAPVERATFRLGEELALPPNFGLGAVDFISGGAITQAAMHALFRLSGISATARVIEPDRLDITNFNRYPLALLGLLGMPKTGVLATHAPPGFTIAEIEALADATTFPLLDPIAARVVIGTDDVPSRWVAQAHAPGWIGVGATAHFSAVVSDHWPGVACARCMHPRDDGVIGTIPTVSFVSYIAGLAVAAQLVREAAGARCPPGDQAREFSALQMGGAHAQRRYRVVPAAGCPFGCDAHCTTRPGPLSLRAR